MNEAWAQMMILPSFPHFSCHCLSFIIHHIHTVLSEFFLGLGAGGSAPAGSFQMQLLSMQGLAKSVQNGQDASDAMIGQEAAPAPADPILSMLDQFPGPLIPSTPKDKVPPLLFFKI